MDSLGNAFCPGTTPSLQMLSLWSFTKGCIQNLKYADVQIISIADLQNLLAGLLEAVYSDSSCLLNLAAARFLAQMPAVSCPS